MEKRTSKKKDYGTNNKASKFDFKGISKSRLAVTNKILNPFDDYDDLIDIIVFLCGICFFLRDGKEISKLLRENYTSSTYEDGPDAGKIHIHLSIFEDKVNKKLRLDQKAISVEDMSYKVLNNHVDLINPYEIYFSISVRFVLLINFFCREQNQTLTHQRRVHKSIIGEKVPFHIFRIVTCQ